MPKIIPDELKAFIEREIASGKYRSEEEVLSAGLRLLQERERKLEALQADLLEGVSELERGERLSGKEVFRELREHVAGYEDQES